MTSATPWSVKGIDPRAREAAREAARRRGLTIGEWLNQAILANEAALAAVRSEGHVSVAGGQDSALAEALAELSQRVDANDRRAALAIGTMDRSLSAIGQRLEGAGPVGGDVDGLLAELREAQAALLHRMRRIEDEELAAVKASRERDSDRFSAVHDRVTAIDENVSHLAAHVSGAEAKTGEALRVLQASLASLDEKVARAGTGIDTQEVDTRFAAIAENLSHEVESARIALAGQLADVLGELRPEEMRAALGDLSKRIAAAERRHAQTIEAVSIEIKRLNESMERRLRAIEARNDDSVAARDQARELAETVEQRFSQMAARESAFAEHISEEIGRVAHGLDARVALSEQRSAEAIGQVGEQVAIVVERLHSRQDRLASELSDRMIDNEQRQAAHLNDALHNLSAVLDQIEARASFQPGPAHDAMTGFADRLQAIEARIAAAPAPAPAMAPESVVAPAPVIEAPPPVAAMTDEALDHHHEALREVAAHLAARSETVSETVAPDTIFVEDIEARFTAESDDETGFESNGDSLKYRLADDPFAEMAAEQSAEDEDLFWSAGREFSSDAAPDTEIADDFLEDEPDSFAAASLSPYAEETDPLSGSTEHEQYDAGIDLNLDPLPHRNSYIEHARRAARASAEPIPDTTRTPAQKGGLKGLSSLVLWTAAGAVAAALAGGVFYYTEQTRQAAEPGPTTAELPTDAAPGSIAESAAKTEAEPVQSAPEQAMPPADPAQPLAPAAPAEPAPTRAAPLHPTSATGNDEAAPTLEEAAQRGDKSAQYQLAIQKFAEGQQAKGIALLRKSAEQGLPMAQYRLAKAYERGEGVASNAEIARQWTERAAAAGNARAMHDLGVYLASAKGAALNEAGAFAWFKRAAELGVPDSQFNIALMYLQGRGAPADMESAFYWFEVAAASGDQDAAARAAMIERQLGSSAKALKEKARAYNPRPVIMEANGVIERSWSSKDLQASASSGPRT